MLLRLLVDNLLAFGNGSVMLPLLQRSFVQETGGLTIDQLLYAFTIARVTPGQANLYVASIGYMMFGLPGAVLAILTIAVPGYLMLPLLHGFTRFNENARVRGFARGLAATAVGLIMASTITLGRGSLTTPTTWVVFGLTIVLLQFLKWNTLLTLGLATGVGMVLTIIPLHLP